MVFEVEIYYTFGGTEEKTVYRKDVNSLDELKESFLKRFGNIKGAPNKTMKEKPLVKQLTYTAKDSTEWMHSINTQTRWGLNIKLV